MHALAAHLPAHRPRPASAVHPFADGAIAATVTAAGLTVTAITERRVRDVDHWMEWMWSPGGRALSGHIPADRLDAVTTGAARVLESAHEVGGGLALTTAMRVTVAALGPGATHREEPS
ncbi:hypothetical protein ACTMS0_28505 [Micromonospora sp. H33]|uniref:hypothetical protein n=1 Tax=Micromonospora sp. H33 TaxID=3452215 RepID=UPI003F888B52